MFVVWVVICLFASGDVWFGFTLWVCYCYACGLGLVVWMVVICHYGR